MSSRPSGHALVQKLDEVIDELAADGPDQLADTASIVELHSMLARLDAVVTTAVAAFDAAQGWAADGAKSPSSWLATRCRIPRREAGRRVGLGRALRQLPACHRAWSDGDITAAHVDVLAGLRRGGCGDAFDRDEALLVDHARRLRFDHFARSAVYWRQLADPDGVEAAAETRRARRDVTLAASFQGMWLGTITLDPISGSVVSEELGRLEQDLYERDWADARLRLGRDPQAGELARTGSQRRADALVDMAARSAAAPVGIRRPRPLFSVLVGYETLHGRVCELARGVPVTPGSLVQWLEHADVERAVFEPSGRVEVSAMARFFTGATRRAIELRDRSCTHPTCDVPAPDCEVDHVVPFAAQGPTTQANGRLLCGFHNRLRNQRPPPAA